MMHYFKLGNHLSDVALAQFFEDFDNMYSIGMGISQILHSLKDTTNNAAMSQVILEIEHKISCGEGFSSAVAQTMKFPKIVPAVIYAGEKTGKLQQALKVLSQYFRQSNDMRGKLFNACVYPAVVFIFLITMMCFVSLHVIPNLRNLLPVDAMNNGSAKWILGASSIVQENWLLIIILPVLFLICAVDFRKTNKNAFECWLYQWPLIGNTIKESEMAFYLLNLSVFLKSGVPLLKAIDDLSRIHASPVSDQFLKCRDYMLGGMPLWEALNKEAFFSSAVIMTLRRGEEMVRIEEYCFNLSEYLAKRVAMNIDRWINLIQPALLTMGGVFLIFIAFAFLVPIYGSLTKIAGG